MERLLGEAEELAELGSWSLELDTREVVWSDGMYRIHGLEPGEREASMELLMEHMHPDDRDRINAILDAPEDAPPEGLTAEYRAVRPDGSVREVRARGRVLEDPDRWVGAAQDVTEQRLTERELQAHYALSQAIRDWESFDEGVMDLLRRVGTALDYPTGAMWTWEEDAGELVVRALWVAPAGREEDFQAVARVLSFRAGEGVSGKVWQTGRPEVVEDLLGALTRERRELVEPLGLQSALAFPALSDHGPLAVLSFYSFDRRAQSERTLRTLEGLGRELGQFLARRRAELGTRKLSGRELEVLKLAAEGHSGPQIAERLFVSPTTVKTHFEHIYEKLGVGDRAAAVAHALRSGVIS